MKTIVVALGGNALEDKSAPSAENQLLVIKKTVKQIASLIEEGYKVVLTHGNGPQVGRILLQNENSAKETPAMPFDVCGAMSQGMIGYHIQQALKEELKTRQIEKKPISLVTQVLVSKDDEAFKDPIKPIGMFYTKEEALKLEKEKGYVLKEDSSRGYRRVVASPNPLQIVELDAIKTLIENNFVVIACGGGGVPVVEDGVNKLKGVDAVIDKDLASAKLAEDLDADILMILTEVDTAMLNYGKPNQQELKNTTTKEIEGYIEEGHFAPGSMLPKIKAAQQFADSKNGRISIVTSLLKVKEALSNKSGTLITK